MSCGLRQDCLVRSRIADDFTGGCTYVHTYVRMCWMGMYWCAHGLVPLSCCLACISPLSMYVSLWTRHVHAKVALPGVLPVTHTTRDRWCMMMMLFGWSSTPKNYIPDKARDGRNVVSKWQLKWQVICWHAWSSEKNHPLSTSACLITFMTVTLSLMYISWLSHCHWCTYCKLLFLCTCVCSSCSVLSAACATGGTLKRPVGCTSGYGFSSSCP